MAVQDAIKPFTHQNYVNYIRAYVRPSIGNRRMQGDLTVQVLNAFYRHLLHNGRRTPTP